MSSPVHIAIASSSYLVSAGLKALVESNADFVLSAEVATAEELGNALLISRPDLLVIDFQAAVFSPDALRLLMKRYKELQVLAVFSHPDRSLVAAAIDAGIHSLLLTECDREEITEAIYKTVAGEKFMCGKIVAITSDGTAAASETSCAGLNITEREIEIIKLLAEGYSNKQIADKLFLSTHTVNTHRKNIMSKLGVNNAAGLVLFAVRENLISPNKYLFSSPN